MDNNKIATVILNPTPSPTGNYLWIPEVSGNVVPGSDPMLTYIQSKYTTLTALQHTVTTITNTIDNEINNIQTEMGNIQISNVSNVSKELHYNTTHTDMFQKM